MIKQAKTDDRYVTAGLRLGHVIQRFDRTFLRQPDPVLGWRAVVRETRSKPGHAGTDSDNDYPPSPLTEWPRPARGSCGGVELRQFDLIRFTAAHLHRAARHRDACAQEEQKGMP